MERVISIITDRLSGVPGLAAVYLFGSAARGTSRSRSDIDVAVLFEENAERIDIVSLMAGLSGAAGRDVDVIILNRAEPRLYHEIVRTGEILFEKNRRYRILREVRNRKLYEDYRRLHSIYMRGMRAEYGQQGHR